MSVVKGVIDLSGGGNASTRKLPIPVRGLCSTAAAQSLETLGRALCAILRHKAEEMGINIRDDGYCRVDDVLKMNMIREFSEQDILKVVETDAKKRFSTLVEEGILFIRANQGHSIKVVVADKLLKEITSANSIPICVHGTYKQTLASIRRTGLSTMGRNHVHFAAGLPKDNGVISGMRTTCNVLIFLDVAKALEDGMKFYMSENRVVLTEGFGGIVPTRYFSRIVEWPSLRPLH